MRASKLTTLCVMCCGFVGVAELAPAAPIQYAFEGVVSGEIDSVSFTNEAFIATAFADTDDISPFSDGVSVLNLAATFEFPNLNGGTLLTVTDPTTTNLNTTWGVVTLGNDRLQTDGVLLFDSSLSSWDMVSDHAPLSISDGVFQTTSRWHTTGGDLRFVDDFAANVSFQAAVIPEPATLALLMLGGVTIVRRAARRN
ncbi:MAG: PEP-CTERM sorting domain-containing protein [Phycisphaerales bacterium]|nr:PEP-CTERM sorting domain-containing protein [Phycisphaerales bacterium]